MSTNIIVSASPHDKLRVDTPKIMWLVNFALAPTIIASAVIFGLQSLIVIGTSVLTCVLTEALACAVLKKENTLRDGSAVITGILLAFTLPPSTPFWMVIIGGVAAIFLVKQLFGGLGFNIFNPALAARALLLSSFPVAMTSWIKPASSFLSPDAVTSASFLGLLKEGGKAIAQPSSYMDMFLGLIPGSLGETCKVTLLAGAALLLITRVIDFRVPLAFIGTVVLFSWIAGRDPLSSLLSGGLILGAFFMSTDMVTTPTTKAGRLIFGAGCGLLTFLIRFYGGFPEGVCYSILLMNCLTPLLDKYVRPRVFGTPSPIRKEKA